MRKALLAAAAGLVLAGCNTVEGFGHDLSATGNAISGAARDTRTAKPAKRHLPAEPGCATNPSHGAAPGVC